MFGFLYRFLEIPIVYRVVIRILGLGGNYLRGKLEVNIYNRPTTRVMDVGCGPDLATPEPTGVLVGVDVNEAYILKYTGGFVDTDPQLIFNPPAARKHLGYVISAEKMPFADGAFDEVRSTALFHHLTDDESRSTLREMVRCTQSGGRIVVFDAVFPRNPWLRPLAYIILKNDRGRHMRNQEQLVGVFESVCPGQWKWTRHTYTYTGMEALYLQYTKP